MGKEEFEQEATERTESNPFLFNLRSVSSVFFLFLFERPQSPDSGQGLARSSMGRLQFSRVVELGGGLIREDRQFVQIN